MDVWEEEMVNEAGAGVAISFSYVAGIYDCKCIYFLIVFISVLSIPIVGAAEEK